MSNLSALMVLAINAAQAVIHATQVLHLQN